MKKSIFALMIVSIVLLTACAQGTLEESEILTIRRRSNGKTLSIGDTRDYVNEVTGGDEANISDFLEDDVQRVDYWDAPGVYVDFLDDKVVALRLTDEDKWEISGGIRIGTAKSKVMEMYADNDMVEEGQQGGLMFSYDKDLNQIPFSIESPYYVVISFEDDKVSFITIQDNF